MVVAVVVKASALRVVVTVVEMAVALVAVTAAVRPVTTTAMVNSSRRALKADVRPRAKAVVAAPVWASSSPQVLRMSHALHAHRPVSLTPCAPA